MKKELIVILLTTGIICLLFVANSKNTEDIMAVDTSFVAKTTIVNQVIAKGNIEEQTKSYVSINQNGVVNKLNFSLGDSVKKGDEIMTIRTNETDSNQVNNSIIDLVSNKNITILDTSNHGEIKIISNVNGVITSIPSVAQESIFSGVPFLSVCNFENLVARVSISEKNIQEVSLNQTVLLTGDSFSGIIYGKVSQIMPYATANYDFLNNSSSVTIEVIVDIENLSKEIIVGCSVEAKIYVSEKKDALIIPFNAIFQEDYKEYVYVLKENQVFKREITTGYEVLENIEVLSGLKFDEEIITSKEILQGFGVVYE